MHIDFEGRGVPRGSKEAPVPVLLGALHADRYEAFVIDGSIEHAVQGRSKERYGLVANATVLGLEAALERIVRFAEEGDRRIICFSEYELQVLSRELGSTHPLVERFRSRFLDAKCVLDKISGRRRIERPDKLTLAHYAASLIPEHVPHQLGGKAARKVRTLQEQKRPKNAERHLHDLLDYNREDCRLTRRCLVEAALELQRKK